VTGLVVTLTPGEMALAAQVGCLQRINAISRGHRHKFGFEASGMDPWATHIHAAAAEYVVARASGTFWKFNLVDDPRGTGDVVGWQVRSTERLDGCLILHPEDPPDARFVLVVGRMPELRIAGWIIARDGQASRYWRSDIRHPAYLVPQRDLEPWT